MRGCSHDAAHPEGAAAWDGTRPRRIRGALSAERSASRAISEAAGDASRPHHSRAGDCGRGGTAVSELLIIGGHVIDPASGVDAPRDVLVRDWKIAAIEEPGRLANLTKSQ